MKSCLLEPAWRHLWTDRTETNTPSWSLNNTAKYSTKIQVFFFFAKLISDHLVPQAGYNKCFLVWNSLIWGPFSGAVRRRKAEEGGACMQGHTVTGFHHKHSGRGAAGRGKQQSFTEAGKIRYTKKYRYICNHNRNNSFKPQTRQNQISTCSYITCTIRSMAE